MTVRIGAPEAGGERVGIPASRRLRRINFGAIRFADCTERSNGLGAPGTCLKSQRAGTDTLGAVKKRRAFCSVLGRLHLFVPSGLMMELHPFGLFLAARDATVRGVPMPVVVLGHFNAPVATQTL